MIFTHRNRQTKIVATLGPASSDIEMIRQLFLAGVDVFRLNFSHGAHPDHQQRLANIRAVEAEMGHPIAVLADLQGPKLRLGQFENGGVDVAAGHQIILDGDTTLGNATRVCMPHPEIIESMQIGHQLLVDDGKVTLKIVDKKPGSLVAEVVSGTKLMDRKGVNLPGTVLNVSVLTKKDRKDLEFILALPQTANLSVDFVALSFVQTAADVAEARTLIGDRAQIMVKLEKPSAVEDVELHKIIALADTVMLARGDLGVEIPAEQVPVVQKRVIRAVRAAGKPLIVATQMLESMISSPTPTRAEASDVATAVFDGADAVMLSAETASGQYPLEAVAIMDRIAQTVEGDALYNRIMDAEHPTLTNTANDAITAAACQVANTINARAIVNFTTTGSTALRTARERPKQPIVGLTPNMATARRLALSYGVTPIFTQSWENLGQMVVDATAKVKAKNMAQAGDHIVITAGEPFGTTGTTNIMRLVEVD
jgi:pyruvate kinase